MKPKINLEWTSINDSLPEPATEVLTYSIYGYVLGRYGYDGRWEAVDTDYETGEPWLRPDGTVTHWMPLPAPPNERGQR